MSSQALPYTAGGSRQRFAYGIGSIGTGVFTTVPSVLLLYFLTTEVGIDAAIAGMVMLIPKLLGLIGDPLIGVWADRLREGSPIRRRVLMATGAALAGAGLWALFEVPQHYKGNHFVPALIYLICTTGYSLFAVPYSALPAELGQTPEARRALVSTRLGIAFLGTLIGGVMAPLLVARAGYAVMGMVLGAVCVASMAAFLISCRLNGNGQSTNELELADIDLTLTNVSKISFKWRLLAFALLLAATGAFSSLLPFLVKDMNGSQDVVGAGMLVNIIAAVLASLAWPAVIRRMSLQRVWHVAASLMCLGVVPIALAPSADLMFFVGMAIAGAGFCGVQIAGFTGLADLTADTLKEGSGGGFLTGVWMAAEKAGLACGPLFAGFGLQFLHITISGSLSRALILIIPIFLSVLSIMAIGLRSK